MYLSFFQCLESLNRASLGLFILPYSCLASLDFWHSRGPNNKTLLWSLFLSLFPLLERPKHITLFCQEKYSNFHGEIMLTSNSHLIESTLVGPQRSKWIYSSVPFMLYLSLVNLTLFYFPKARCSQNFILLVFCPSRSHILLNSTIPFSLICPSRIFQNFVIFSSIKEELETVDPL